MGQPGSTGLGLANEGGITIEMSGSQASWQDRPYQQEVTMTNPPSWGYDLAGGEAARFIELSGQMASREQAGIEQDEAGQAVRSPGMTPRPRRNRLQAALGRIAGGMYVPCGLAARGLANDVPGRPVAVALASSDSRMPVAVSTAMTAVSRRWAKLRPAHARSSRVSSSAVKTGTSLSVTRGGASPAIGSGSWSSAASHSGRAANLSHEPEPEVLERPTV